MRANKSQNTKPEVAVRQMLHALGYRFRLHRRDLPGKPDIVFPSRRKIIEVRGCFWHGHGCVPLGQLPKTRPEYWVPKIAGNRERDTRNIAALHTLGWEVCEVWECAIRSSLDQVREQLTGFLNPPPNPQPNHDGGSP
jgi:DNA mismatch endonuclease (patch repair protein)